MLYVVAFVVAAGLGFAGSRLLRRPSSAAQAASVARNVGGSLGARKGLDAPELQRACFSEMVRHVRVNREGRTSAPGAYLLRLNPGDMAVVDERGRVDLGGEDGTWQIPLSIDGTETVVEGELVRLDAPSAWPWYLAAALASLVLVGGVVALGAGRWAVSVALVITAASAVYVAATELSEAPKGSGASSVPLIIAVAALLGSLGTTVATGMGSRGQPAARVSTALAAATLLWWGATRIAVFANTILPSNLDAVDRTATAAALALGAAVAVLIVWRPGLMFGSGEATAPDPA